jgi:hypothetical protein
MPLSTTIVAETLQMWYIMPLSPFWQTKRKFCKAACIIWSIINGQKFFIMSCPLTLRPLGRKIWIIQKKIYKSWDKIRSKCRLTDDFNRLYLDFSKISWSRLDSLGWANLLSYRPEVTWLAFFDFMAFRKFIGFTVPFWNFWIPSLAW